MIASVTHNDAINNGGQVFGAPDQPVNNAPALGIGRDTYWPKSVAAMAIVSLLLIVASVQLVSPTRRWRIPRPVPVATAPAAKPPEATA